MKEKLDEINENVSQLMHEYPKLFGHFMGFVQGVREQGVLEAKTEALIP